jgi:Arc/MetJ-type ribon-helix-helix transcriptional regulator
MPVMKLSVSLPDEDVEFLDALSVELGLAGRSAALQRAVRALRESRLEAAYAAAVEEWASSSVSEWDRVISDGLG